MTVRVTSVLIGALAVAACTTSSGGAQTPVDSVPSVAGEPTEAVVSATTTTTTTAAATTTAAPVPEASTTTAPVPEEPAEGADELVVGLLLADSGVARVLSAPVGVAAGKASQDIAQVGLPFEFRRGDFGTAFQYTGGDIAADLEMFLDDFDAIAQDDADIIIGPNPGVDLADLTSRAAQAGVAFVVPGYVHDGSIPTQGIRFDIAGSIDTQIDLIAQRVAAAEVDAVVVTAPTDSDVAVRIESGLLDAGVLASAIGIAPTAMASEIAAAADEIVAMGDRVAVVLSPGESNVGLVDAVIARQPGALVFAGDFSLTRADVAAIEVIGSGQITVVRRANDLSRPEQADFVVRMLENNPDLGRMFDAAEVFDMYVLAALASVEAGAATSEEVAARIIDLSRGGEPCTEVAVCFAFLENGIDIDYDGLSGPIEFDDRGVATATWFAVDVAVPRTGELVTEEFVLQRG